MTNSLLSCLTVRGEWPPPASEAPSASSRPVLPSLALAGGEKDRDTVTPAVAGPTPVEVLMAGPRHKRGEAPRTPPSWEELFRKSSPSPVPSLLPQGPVRRPLFALPHLLSSLGMLTLTREGVRQAGPLHLLLEAEEGSLLHPRDSTFHQGVFQRHPQEVVVDLQATSSLRRLVIAAEAPVSGVLSWRWSAFPEMAFDLPLPEVGEGFVTLLQFLFLDSIVARNSPQNYETLKALALAQSFETIAWRL